MKNLKIVFYFSIVFLTACADSFSENTTILLRTEETKSITGLKKKDPVPEHSKRDTIQLEHLIEKYTMQYKSTNGLDTLINGTYESIYQNPVYTLEIVDTISSKDFAKIKNSYASNKNPLPLITQTNDSIFLITTSDYIVECKLPSSQGMGNEPYYTNLNRIEKLNAFTFTQFQGSGGGASSSFWLMDRLTSKMERVDAYYAQGYDHLSVSKDKSKLICSASNEYGERGAAIKIMTINWMNERYQLQHLLDFRTEKWSVGKCYMIDTARIAVSTYNSFESHYKATKYSKTKAQDDPNSLNSHPIYLILQITKNKIIKP